LRNDVRIFVIARSVVTKQSQKDCSKEITAYIGVMQSSRFNNEEGWEMIEEIFESIKDLEKRINNLRGCL
jgi:uncharacterized protein YrzB (UPF0473 family)